MIWLSVLWNQFQAINVNSINVSLLPQMMEPDIISDYDFEHS